MSKTKQIKWLNCAKCFAILAVIVDHTNGVLYTNQHIAMGSYFSVSLFILVAGITSYMSDLRHNETGGGTFLRNSKKMAVAYCIATFIYQVYYTHAFDFTQYINYLAHFNISAPLYYVLLYFQLMLVNRLLFNYLQYCSGQRYGYLYEAFGFVVIVATSIFTTNYTNILNVYGGGGKLLGGTYLILYYVGMMIAKHKWLEDTSVRKSAIIFVIAFPLWILWWRFMCSYGTVLDQYVPFGGGFNPPSITFMTLAILMLCTTFGLFTLLERYKYTEWIVNITNWVGKHTLNIFLYHLLMMNIVSRYVVINDIWTKRGIYIIAMIFGSILLGKVIDYITTKLKHL